MDHNRSVCPARLSCVFSDLWHWGSEVLWCFGRSVLAAAFAAPVIPSWLVCSWSLGLLLLVLTASTAKSGFLQLVALLLQEREREPNF